mgnify:CR=1 FL=1
MGFLDKLKAGLSKTKNAIFGQIDEVLKAFVKVDEDLLEELEELLETDKKAEIKNTDWHVAAEQKRAAMLAGRQFTMDEVKEHLANGDPFVIRILANGDPEKKTKFTDMVKGNLEVPENDEDESDDSDEW